MKLNKLYLFLFMSLFLLSFASASLFQHNQVFRHNQINIHQRHFLEHLEHHRIKHFRNYGTYDIHENKWLGLFRGQTTQSYTLLSSGNSIINAYAILEVKNYKTSKLLSKMSFKGGTPRDLKVYYWINKSYIEKKPIYKKVCSKKYSYINKSFQKYCKQIKIRTKRIKKYRAYWKEYKNQYLQRGDYKIKITAKLPRANKKVDWVLHTGEQNIALSNWLWWDNSWSYKKQINFTANVGQFSYLETIPYSANMNADFSDLRFVDTATETTEYNYTIESYIASTSAIVRIFSQGASSVMMYYGNAGATTTSSASNTYFNPVSYYYLDGNVNDALGVNNGTNYGATSTTGKIGGAYSFDGSSNYIDTNADLQDNVENFSVEAWFKLDNTPGHNVIIQTRGSGDGESLTLSVENGYLTFMIDTAGYYVGRDYNTILNTGIWYHVVGVVTSSSGQTFSTSMFAIYLDGLRVDNADHVTGTISGTSPFNGLGTTKIGYHEAWNSYFNGTIDELGIWNKALTSTQISELYQSTAPTFTIGSEQSSAGVLTTLNSPSDNFKSNSSNILFNWTSTPNNVNLTNTTLYLWDGVGNLSTTFYSLSGTSPITTTQTNTLSDGSYIWNAETCGDGVNCSFATNRSFSIDTVYPIINITSPTNGTFDYLYSNQTMDLNFTATDTNLDSCWYYYPNIPQECYQESANVSNQTGIDGNCGLQYSGSYSFIPASSGDWANKSNIIDGNYSTYGYVPNNFPTSAGVYEVNYTYPLSNLITDATWELKLKNTNSIEVNYSLADCINNNSNKLMLKATGGYYTNPDTSTVFRTTYFYCYNSSGWKKLGYLFEGSYNLFSIYDEAVIWKTPTVTKINCSINTTFQYQNDYNSITVMANDTHGNLAHKSSSWDYKILYINQSYKNETYITDNNNFNLVFKTPSTILENPYLIYNGKKYNATSKTLGNQTEELSYSLLTDESLVGNNTFNWEVTLDGVNVTTDSFNQTVKNLNFAICNQSNNATYLSINFKDELKLIPLNAIIRIATFNYYIKNKLAEKNYTFITAENKSKFDFCLSNPNKNITLISNINYYAKDYPERSYGSTFNLSNQTTNLTLNLLSINDGIYATFDFLDSLSQSLLSNVNVIISDGITTIKQETGAGGKLSMWLNPNVLYSITASKIGYLTTTQKIRPVTITAYPILMEFKDIESNTQLEDGLEYKFYPQEQDLKNNTNYIFKFYTKQGEQTISETKVSLYDDNNNLIEISMVPSQGELALSQINTLENKTFKLVGEINGTDGGYVKYTAIYYISVINKGKYSLAEWGDNFNIVYPVGERTTTTRLIWFIIWFVSMLSGFTFGYNGSFETKKDKQENISVETRGNTTIGLFFAFMITMIFSYFNLIPITLTSSPGMNILPSWLQQNFMLMIIGVPLILEVWGSISKHSREIN